MRYESFRTKRLQIPALKQVKFQGKNVTRQKSFYFRVTTQRGTLRLRYFGLFCARAAYEIMTINLASYKFVAGDPQ